MSKKQLAIGGGIIGTCAVSALLLFQLLYRTYSPSAADIALAGGIAIVLLGTVALVSALLLTSKKMLAANWGSGLVAFLFFFGWQLEYIASLVLVLAGLIGVHAIIQKEYKDRITLRPFWMFMRGAGLQMTILAFLFAMSYYSSPRFTIELPHITLPETVVKKAITLFGDELRIPVTVEDLAFTVEELPEAKKSWFTEKLSNVSGEEPVLDAISRVLGTYINNWIQSTARINGANISPVLFVFGSFVLIRTLSIPIAWLVIILSTIAVHILERLHFIEIKKIQQKKEIIQL